MAAKKVKSPDQFQIPSPFACGITIGPWLDQPRILEDDMRLMKLATATP